MNINIHTYEIFITYINIRVLYKDFFTLRDIQNGLRRKAEILGAGEKVLLIIISAFPILSFLPNFHLVRSAITFLALRSASS